MHMRRTPGMAALHLQHLADWTVVRNGIGGRLDRPEMEAAVLVGVEARAHRKIADLVELLHVIIAVIVGMPDVDDGPRKWTSIDGRDRAGDQHRVTLHRTGDISAVLLLG